MRLLNPPCLIHVLFFQFDVSHTLALMCHIGFKLHHIIQHLCDMFSSSWFSIMLSNTTCCFYDMYHINYVHTLYMLMVCVIFWLSSNLGIILHYVMSKHLYYYSHTFYASHKLIITHHVITQSISYRFFFKFTLESNITQSNDMHPILMIIITIYKNHINIHSAVIKTW